MRFWWAGIVVFAVIGGCATADQTARPMLPVEGPSEPPEQRGLASWYGAAHHGRPTSSGEPFDMHALTAAHLTLPLGTRVRVTALSTGRSVEVRINDRGPFVGGRIIDLSEEAARRLGSLNAGVIPVSLRIVGRTEAVASPVSTK
jgi:rare lipoprotein A